MGVPFYDYYRGYYYIWEGPNDWRMHMAHCDSYIAPAGIWGPVKQGQAVARADNTGVSLGDHVHIDWLNPQKMGPEAVWKPQLNAWAHDVEKWIGKDIGWTTQEDWFDMATETDLKKVVKGELDNWFRSAEFAMIVRQEAIGQIYNILFDHGVGAPDDERRLMRMSYTLEQNNRILFDVTPTVDPNDKRRMIDTRNMVKEIKDKVGA
jgi:murein DD-endopeptidase MepM/ murein hydrolase activator NlpD